MATTDTPEAVASLTDALETLTRQEPTWLQAARRAAWARFQATALPDRTDDAWRRLDLHAFAPAAFPPVLPLVDAGSWPVELQPAFGVSHEQDAGGLLFDARGSHRWLNAEAAAQGIVLQELTSALTTHASLLQPWLTTSTIDGKLGALPQALWNRGAFLYIPPRVRVALPIRLALTEAGRGCGYFPRTAIILDEGAEAVVIDETITAADGGANLVCGLATIVVKAGGRLTYAALQQLDRQTQRFSWQQVRVERDAHCRLVNGEFGGRVSRLELSVELAGSGARADLAGLVMGRGDQHSDVHTFQQHIAPHTTSDLFYKSVLRDRAHATYQGLIRVTKQAQKTDAYQANKNLLLSSEAKAESIPKLEIEADDVRCTHGATVGHVDDEQRFYLMSRGLSPEEADRMIVEGFVEDLLERVPEEAVRARMRWHAERARE